MAAIIMFILLAEDKIKSALDSNISTVTSNQEAILFFNMVVALLISALIIYVIIKVVEKHMKY